MGTGSTLSPVNRLRYVLKAKLLPMCDLLSCVHKILSWGRGDEKMLPNLSLMHVLHTILCISRFSSGI